MEINDQQKKNPDQQESMSDRLREQGGIEHNNRPEENKEEDYVKDDQQSDLSYGRNNGRTSDNPTSQN